MDVVAFGMFVIFFLSLAAIARYAYDSSQRSKENAGQISFILRDLVRLNQEIRALKNEGETVHE